MKKVISFAVIAVAFALSLLSAAVAIAAEPKPAEPKWSIEIGGGNSSNMESSSKYNLGYSELNDYGPNNEAIGNGGTFSAEVGYSLQKHIKVTLGYYDSGKFEYTSESTGMFEGYPTNEKEDHSRRFQNFAVGANFGIPMTVLGVEIRPSLFGKIGVGKYSFQRQHELTLEGLYTETYDTTGSGSGICYSMGIGLDIKVYKGLFLWSKGEIWKMKSHTDHNTEYAFRDNSGAFISNGIDADTNTFTWSAITAGIGYRF